jgi:hypothetical protein
MVSVCDVRAAVNEILTVWPRTTREIHARRVKILRVTLFCFHGTPVFPLNWQKLRLAPLVLKKFSELKLTMGAA